MTIEERKEYYKPYQHIIDKVTLEECIEVVKGIPIHCNREEMIREAIIQRLSEPKVVVNQNGNDCVHINNVGTLYL